MMMRRSFFATLLAPFLARFAPKRFIGMDLSSGPDRTAISLWPTDAPTSGYFEFPDPIEDLRVIRNELYVFTQSGVYQIFGDATYKKLDKPLPFVPFFQRKVPWLS